MWVVKLGGSLYRDALLPGWLELLAQLGGGRVVIVCGGGSFADEVRQHQAQWQFPDLAAHNMAVLAMAQGAFMLQGMQPALRLAGSEHEIRRGLRGGHTVVWAPYELLREEPDESTHWGHTSDSVALALARRLNVERLVLVKSCEIEEAASLAELAAGGVVDSSFAPAAESAGFAIDIVQREQLDLVREQLLAGSGPPAQQGVHRWR
jgi:5-(aminomethyl)-3-furanmethanol phosphate kinase